MPCAGGAARGVKDEQRWLPASGVLGICFGPEDVDPPLPLRSCTLPSPAAPRVGDGGGSRGGTEVVCCRRGEKVVSEVGVEEL
jgi:hypothetical protein